LKESDTTSSDAISTARATPLALMGDRTFVALWLTGAIINVIRWLEVLAIGVFAFDLTGSPLVVSFLLLVRTVPMSVVGFWVALLAEKVGSRRLLLVILTAMIPASLVLAWLVYIEEIEIWHLTIGVILSGCLQAADMPVRRLMLGEVAGLERVGAAMSLDSSTNHITRLLGPILGGVVLVTMGLDGAFLLSASFYVLAIGLLLTVPAGESLTPSAGSSIIRNLIEGVRLARGSRMLVGVLWVTVIHNICGFPFLSMVPVIGKDVLNLGPVEVGLLTGAEGAGAFVGAMIAAVLARPQWFLRIYLYGSVLAMATILLFGLSGTVLLSSIAMLIAGLGAAGFGSMQSAIIFAFAPPHLRGRLMGVLVFCIGVGPLGYLQLGLLADWWNASAAVTIVAIEGLIALAIVMLRYPELRRAIAPGEKN
jgi:MFS family permease